MSDDYDIGYRKPPKKHQFQKGQSGNPCGRPLKPKPAKDARSVFGRLLTEEFEVGGRKMTPVEIAFRSLLNRAMKGEPAAIREVNKMIEKFGMDAAKPVGGVLVVPGVSDFDDWERMAFEQQRKFREGPPPDLEKLLSGENNESS